MRFLKSLLVCMFIVIGSGYALAETPSAPAKSPVSVTASVEVENKGSCNISGIIRGGDDGKDKNPEQVDKLPDFEQPVVESNVWPTWLVVTGCVGSVLALVVGAVAGVIVQWKRTESSKSVAW